MAITSVGYDGTVDEVAWAKMQAGLGRREGVDSNGLTVTIKTGTTVPTLTVGAGSAFAYGVYDTIDVATDVPMSAPPTTSGVVRWDTCVLRRNWSTNTTTLVMVTGTTSMAIAASLNNNPGVLHDQPIALLQATGGQTVATDLWDVRHWPTHDTWFLGPNPPTASRYPYGANVLWRDAQHGSVHLVRRGNAGAETWDNLDDPPWSTLNIGGGMVAGTSVPQYRVRRGQLQMRGNGRRVPTTNNGVWTATATASLEVNVGILPAELAPETHSSWPVSTEGAQQVLRGVVNTSGELFITLPAGQSFGGVYYNAITYPVKVNL